MKKHLVRTRMSVHVIGAIVLLLIVFGIIISTIGYLSFSRSFPDNEYLNREEVDECGRTTLCVGHIERKADEAEKGD
ncbi:MAG: hypothetical protein IKD88_01020 [Lachnospiraceae bacterium]|nr:hypothetical protein [Lachnospiraceae bacterium]